MKFSWRITLNCKRSSRKHILAVFVELYLLILILPFLAIMLYFLFTGELWDELGVLSIIYLLFLCGLLGLFAYGTFLLIRFSVRRISANNLSTCLKELQPFGDPESLLRAVDDLPDRGLGGVDLRFDEEYLAIAKNREILICRLDQIRYFYDFGVNTDMRQRRVFLFLPGREPLLFDVKSTAHTHQVLSELYAGTAFGKWILSGDLNHSYAPFVHKHPGSRKDYLQCDGKILKEHRKEGWSDGLPLTELASCYLYYVPDGDTSDDYYLNLYLQDGRIWKIEVASIHEGFQLYLQLLNCAPQLAYRFPNEIGK